jgi:GGDEF domain-containing protein
VAVSCSYGTHELRAGENADAAMASADLAMYAHKRERV